MYSIAICLSEYLATNSPGNPFQIFGTDISEHALETARAGSYIENIARNVSAERLARFFTREGTHYRVSKALRDHCTFARQNVAYDPPFSRIDLVSCRNLLIYLDPALQKRIMPSLHFALQREGVLMLGQSETVGVYSELFHAIETKRGKFFGKSPVAGRPSLILTTPTPGSGAAVQPRRTGVDIDKDPLAHLLRSAVDRIALSRYVPACVVCDEKFNVIEFRGDTGPFLLNPQGAPTNRLPRLARPSLAAGVADALRLAGKGEPVRKTGLEVEVDAKKCSVAVEVIPVRPADTLGRWFVVFFELLGPLQRDPGEPVKPPPAPSLVGALVARMGAHAQRQASAGRDSEVGALREEQRALREQVRVMLEEHESAIEELKALEEETLSSNEEFQSTNEELETAKEELQSINEELSTANDELNFRNRELKIAHEV